jgi:hypothetical protein
VQSPKREEGWATQPVRTGHPASPFGPDDVIYLNPTFRSYTCVMPELPFQIPQEVIDWIRAVFADVNLRVSQKLTRIPTTHETSLDITLIEELSQHAAPFRFSSSWSVRLETHYLGGGRYWGQWEIADIGILVIFRRGGAAQQTKIALLQSKRLYPVEAEASAEDHRIDYAIGFGRLLPAEQEYKSSVRERTFTFVKESRYRAFEYQGKQYKAVLSYTDDSGLPVHYLLYNPTSLPIRVSFPIEARGISNVSGNQIIGCRVISARTLDGKLKTGGLKKGENPMFQQLFGSAQDMNLPPWTLDYFIADLVLSCKEGHVAGVTPMEDEALFNVFNRRSGPISAAIAVTIDAPA